MDLNISITNIRSQETLPLNNGRSILPDGFICESGKYLINVTTVPSSKLTLTLFGQPLSPKYQKISEKKTSITWDWEVAEYAGEVQLALYSEDIKVFQCLIDIPPHFKKLGREEFSQLLESLQSLAEGIIFGTTPGLIKIEEKSSLAPSLAQLVLLGIYLDQMEKALDLIRETPHRRLISHRVNVSMFKAKKVDNKTLKALVKNVNTALCLKQKEFSGTLYPEPQLDVPSRQNTFNTSSNRYILFLIRSLLALCGSLKVDLEKSKPKQSPLEFSPPFFIYENWINRLSDFKKRINNFSNSNFLKHLKPSKPDDGAFLTLTRNPAYGLFHHFTKKILHPRICIGMDPEKHLTLRNTYDLYEFWCFFKICEILKRSYKNLEWETHIPINSDGILLDLEDGSKISGKNGDFEISLEYQKVFNRLSKIDEFKTEPFSISRKCIPDFLLTIKEGDSSKSIILDAKYRASVPAIKEGLRDIHIYRDTIRDSNNKQALFGAFIITPSHVSEANFYYTNEYRSRFKFGGFDLSPGDLDKEKELEDFFLQLSI